MLAAAHAGLYARQRACCNAHALGKLGLCDVDRAMGRLSGPATACVLRRQRDVFGDERFARLGSIAVGHLYNLRHSAGYRNQRVVLTKTQPTKNTKIGVRKAPAPEGRQTLFRRAATRTG
jgi:hypothetical protein